MSVKYVQKQLYHQHIGMILKEIVLWNLMRMRAYLTIFIFCKLSL